jgi:hypothetical protein
LRVRRWNTACLPALHRHGPRVEAASRSAPTKEKAAQQAVDEARMVLPGIQALFGFQLIAGFNQGFRNLPPASQNLHYAALILTTLAIAVIMTPAAYHRIVEQGGVSRFFVRLISWLVTLAMVPLMIALCLEVYVAGALILSSQTFSIAIAAVLLVIFAALWFGFPFALRRLR